jgi:predicted nuclease of predicted toxin-antitoxin system
VKLLLDENLSRKLVARLADLYPESDHVVDIGLRSSPDREVWEFAGNGGFMIVTADSDFYELATTLGPPPKVIWLRRWTHPTRDAEQLLRREAVRIADFAADPELGVLVLDRGTIRASSPKK